MKTEDLQKASVLSTKRKHIRDAIEKLQEKLKRPYGELIRKGECHYSISYVTLTENIERMVITLAIGDAMQQLSVIKAELISLGIED